MTTFYGEHSKVWVSVDCIIFGFDEGKLRILIGKRQMDPGRGEWSLYGGFVRSDENIDESANRVLYDLTGLRNLYMRQVGAFGSVDRDPGERVISIAYYALINVNDYDDHLRREHGVEWVNIDEIPRLYSDHNEMVRKALKLMRQKIKSEVSACFQVSSRSRSCSVSMRPFMVKNSTSVTFVSASRRWTSSRRLN